MYKFHFKSIRNRLIFWFLIVAVIPLISALIIMYFQNVRIMERETLFKLTAIRDLKIENLEHWFEDRKNHLYIMSTDDELSDLEYITGNYPYDNRENEILERSRQIINRYYEYYYTYFDISIINPENNEILVSTNNSIINEKCSVMDNYNMSISKEELFISEIHYCESLFNYTISYSIPIFCSQHKGNHIVGILVARLNLDDTLYKVLGNKVGLGETGETLIVNKDSVVLSSLRWAENSILNRKLTSISGKNSALGKTGISINYDYRGEKVIAAYTYVEEMGWGFIAKQDFSELYRPIKSLLTNLILIFSLITIIIYILAFFIGNTISKPIITMEQLSYKIKSGDYSIRNSIKSLDELGSLATSMNEVTDSIEHKVELQKGILDISQTLMDQTSIRDFANTILRKLLEKMSADQAMFYVLNDYSSNYECFVSIGISDKRLKILTPGDLTNNKHICLKKNNKELNEMIYNSNGSNTLLEEVISIPVIIDNINVAIILLTKPDKFTKEAYDLIIQSHLNLNSYYSNLISNERTRILAETLTKVNYFLEEQKNELQTQSNELNSQKEALLWTTEQLRSKNEELEKKQTQIEEANRLKSEFLSNMSHELRTPLNSIMALSRALILQAEDKLDEEENSYLKIVERNGKHLLELINDILDLSKIEAGKIDISYTEVSIDSLLSELVESFDLIVTNKGLKMNLIESVQHPLLINTDQIRLNQILINIIGNAVKFTSTGHIDIVLDADQENIYISIRDTGIGISEENLPFIFDEFRQVDGTSSREYEGTGLGLAIVYKMIKLLGGDIKVNSRLGEGSVFQLILQRK